MWPYVTLDTYTNTGVGWAPMQPTVALLAAALVGGALVLAGVVAGRRPPGAAPDPPAPPGRTVASPEEWEPGPPPRGHRRPSPRAVGPPDLEQEPEELIVPGSELPDY
jgi:hypothetical protein